MLAHKMIAKVPANVEIDDLIQAGMIGLADAAERFDSTLGLQFDTFASHRIRGAMLDELRSNDYVSRGTRERQRTIGLATRKLELKFGRPPREREVAFELGMELFEYRAYALAATGVELVYLEDLSGDEGDNEFLDRHVGDEDHNPLAQLQDQRMREALVEAIKALPDREQFVMHAVYEDGLELDEIGAVLGVTGSRICQIHAQAIARLRLRLRAH